MLFKKLFPTVEHSVKYNPAIDGLRGIAVMLVVLFHIYPGSFFSFGYVGVDIFFVISGFLITQIIIQKIRKGNFSFKEFYRNRIRRIFPAMLIVLMFFYLIGYLFMFPTELRDFSSHIVWSGFFAENWKLIIEANDYWNKNSIYKPILHYWSLSIEEQFYLFWPLLVIFLSKLKWRIEYLIILIILLLFIIPQFFNINAYYHSLSRFWELLMGGLVAVIVTDYSESKVIKSIEQYEFVFLILFLVSILVSFGNNTYNYYKTMLLIISTGLLIISINKGDKLKILSSFVLVSIGMISYSLYLWHYPIISFVVYYLGLKVKGIYVLFASLFISFLSFRFIELPFRKSNSYRLSIILLLILLSIISVSFYTEIKNGLPDRNSIQKFKKYWNKVHPLTVDSNGLLLLKKFKYSSKLNISFVRSSSSDSSKKYVIILGDSHAHLSYTGISYYFKRKQIETLLLGNNGCAPYSCFLKCKNDDELFDNYKILNFLNSFNNNIHSIIFITRVNYYLKQLKDINEIKNCVNETFNILSDLRVPVFFLIQIPQVVLIRPSPFQNDIYEESLHIYRSKYINQREYVPIIKEIAKKYRNIHIIDPESVFCDYEKCYIIKNDTLMYYDDNHISVEGSYILGRYIVNEVMKVIGTNNDTTIAK
ncbi:MAG TPA: acyltransferase family protein [Bacteroidia bacterium]|nr:acyltransferase family protein [Bacteroidia bacterium]